MHLINRDLTQRQGGNCLISVALKHNNLIIKNKSIGKTEQKQFPVLTWDPDWTVPGLEIWRKSPAFPLLSFLWVIDTGYDYSLQLYLKPVLSFHCLLVFSHIVHELDFTDGSLAVRSVNCRSVNTTSNKRRKPVLKYPKMNQNNTVHLLTWLVALPNVQDCKDSRR